MIRWTGLAPREFEFPFPGSLTFTFLCGGGFQRPLIGRTQGGDLIRARPIRAGCFYSQAPRVHNASDVCVPMRWEFFWQACLASVDLSAMGFPPGLRTFSGCRVGHIALQPHSVGAVPRRVGRPRGPLLQPLQVLLLMTEFIKEVSPFLPNPCHFQNYDQSMCQLV